MNNPTIGMVGCGKLGLPAAVAMKHYHPAPVLCYEKDARYRDKSPRPYVESGIGSTHSEKVGDFNNDLKHSQIVFTDLQNLVDHADIIFVAVQTPHDERFGGDRRFPADERADFDYSYLISACEQIACSLPEQDVEKTIAIISTVLPGTTRKYIMPLFEDWPGVEVVYNPSFIAMGTTIPDYVDPEMVLIGGDESGRLTKFYREMFGSIWHWMGTRHRVPITGTSDNDWHVLTKDGDGKQPPTTMSIESAELAKVAYNTYIGMKIVWANTMMEICEHIPEADCDQVTDALAFASRRLHGPAYTRGGMGDGGGCHPRDNIAMSWLASELGLSCNFFEHIMKCRQSQSDFLAKTCVFYALNNSLPVLVLGTAFKKNIGLEFGSPALLAMEGIQTISLGELDVSRFDPFVNDGEFVHDEPTVVLIGTNHDCFKDYKFASGSIVIDPWRMIEDQDGVKVVRIGEAKA